MNITTRNRIFTENEGMILRTLKRNRLLLRALNLELDDIYQELAIAALDAIDSFDPQRSEDIQAHIWMKLQYAILDIKRRHKPHGITGMSEPEPRFYSVELWEELGCPLAAPVREQDDGRREQRLHQAMARLEPQERAVVILYLDGVKPRRWTQISEFESALGKLRDFYMAAWSMMEGAV